MAVYFKFKSAKDYDSISIEGHFISVGNLKEKVVEKKNLARGSDFDLVISNAETNEEYNDEATLVPKNTSVLVRRVPGRPRKPLVAEVRDEKVLQETSKDQFPPTKPGLESSHVPPLKQPEEPDWADEFGMDLYSIPEEHHQHQLVLSKLEEDNKIKAFVDASASDWQRQTQESFPSGRGFGRGSQARGSSGRGLSRGFEKRTPPQGYVCHRCGIPGHYIQHCPTNGDPAFDLKKVKPPTGIPKSMLVANPDGSYALPSGGVAVLRPNEAVFQKEIEGLPSHKTVGEIPPELRCPLCGGVLKDAVLTSKCCFKSYCDKCIRDQIISKGKCVCGAVNILADDLLPNKTLRDAINRLLEATTATSSAENAGSLHQAQDMESARCPKPKALSPSASASHKDVTVTLSLPDGSNAKDLTVGNKLFFQQSQLSLDKSLAHKRLDTYEHTPESVSILPPSQDEFLGFQNTPQVEEEVQQQAILEAAKRKKVKSKRQRPLYGEKEMHWGGATFEFPVDGGLMPYRGNPAPYSNYWTGHQWLGDGFGQPCGNPSYPYVGYGGPGPVSCEMHYSGAIMSHEPFSHTAFMPPVPAFQRDCMDYNTGTYNTGSGIMSREEFEARKAELRRKRELEQRVNNRDQANDLGNGDLGSFKMKRRSNMVNSPVSSPPEATPDVNDDIGTTLYSKAAGNLSSPRSVGRRWHEKREGGQVREHQVLDSKLQQISKDAGDNQAVQKGGEASGRPEKRPKASVFTRISFPERSKRQMAEKHSDNLESEGDGNMGSAVLRNRRALGRAERSGAEKHSISVESMDDLKHGTSQLRESKKLLNGRVTSYEEDWSRPMNRAVNISKIQDVSDLIDEDADEQNFKRRTTYTNSLHEMHSRGGDHSKEGNYRSVRVKRDRIGLSKG